MRGVTVRLRTSQSGPILRAAVTADAGDLAAIHFEGRRDMMPWLPEVHTPSELLWYVRHVVVEKMAVSVIEVDGHPVAFVADTRGWLEHLYVRPDYWRQGFGTRLLRTVQERQCEMQLWTHQANRASRAFFAVMGFETVELTDGARNTEKEPDVRLVWREGGRVASPVNRFDRTLLAAE